MPPKFVTRLFLSALAALISITAAATSANAQAQAVAARPSRITQAIDEANVTTLRGNTHPLAQARFDQGPAPDSLPLSRMQLVLKRNSDQETALDQLLDQQQDPTSPNFHQWLTPQQFGQQFGPSDQDIQTITNWLQSRGFQVNAISNGRTVIEFSGNADQVRQAFHTTIHRYTADNESHWANSSDPQIPAALAPVVAGINTLYNFPRRAMHTVSGEYSRATDTGKYQPAPTSTSNFTLGGQCGVPAGCYGVSPYDFATIYNLLPLWNAIPAKDGTGETIAIIGQTDISLSDVQSFRNYFGLPPDTVNVIVNGPDPGISPNDETESDLDVEWSGAVARNATIDFVIAESTESSAGVDLAAQYAVDNNIAPVLSESYGDCELFLGTAGNQFFSQLWQQAAAQGITVLVSEGDSGAAVCDRNARTQGAAQYGLSVNGFASTPYNVSVGGTDFNDLTNTAPYWSTTNTSPVPGAPATKSAIQYIPETTWNDTCTNAVFGNLLGFSTSAEANCNNSQLQARGFVVAVGGSGGKSNCSSSSGRSPLDCTTGYPKPSWQTALTPSDSSRDVPDVSLYAAAGGPSGAFYVICEADAIAQGHTSCDPTDPSTHFLSIGGTSASTPAFAGIMTIVNQATGVRQGNANYSLYKLAAASGASCNSSNGAGTNCVFYDTTNGTIAMPCVTGSPNCQTSNQADSVGVLSGYATTSGYDLATGLGSVNVANLISKWTSFESNLKACTTTLTLNNGSAVNITHGQSVPVTITVGGTGGTPSGTVSLIAQTGANTQQAVGSAVLSGGTATFSTNSIPGGSNISIFAQYEGDGLFKASNSASQPVTVAPEPSTTMVTVELFNPYTNQLVIPIPTSYNYGSFYTLLRMNVTSSASDACPANASGPGCPTGTLALSDAVGSTSGPLDGGSFSLSSSGYAEDQVADFAIGTNLIQASYPGDTSYSSSSGSTTITVDKGAASTLFNPPPTSNFGDPFVANVTVESTGVGAAPTGQVSLFAGSTQIGGPVALSNGNIGAPYAPPAASATIVTSQLPLGVSSLSVQYSGDNHYTGYPSGMQSVVTRYLTSAVVGTSNSTIQRGTSVTFTATVNPEHPGGPAMTGTVTFLDGTSALGTPVTLVNNQAQFTAPSLSAGTHTISITYSGDSNYTSATAALTGGETVNLLSTTTTLTTANASITVGQSVTLTATVSPIVSGGPAITGFVAFDACPTPSCLFALGTASISNGQAQLTTSIIPLGTTQVTATYNGDSNYNYSNATTTETVAGPSFSVSANPASLTISAPGQSASTTLTFTSQNGLTGSGSLSSSTCGASPTEEITCTLSAFTLPANGTTTATLTFNTTAASAAPPLRQFPQFPGANPNVRNRLILFAVFMAFAGLIASRLTPRHRTVLACGAILLVVLAVGIACGGGSSGGGGGPTNPGTPLGNAPVSVSISIGGTAQTVPNLTVTVQ